MVTPPPMPRPLDPEEVERLNRRMAEFGREMDRIMRRVAERMQRVTIALGPFFEQVNTPEMRQALTRQRALDAQRSRGTGPAAAKVLPASQRRGQSPAR